MSTEFDIKAFLLTAYGQLVTGDASRLTDHLDENVIWNVVAPESLFPHAGKHVGKQAVIDTISVIYGQYKFSRMRPVEMVVSDDSASTLVDVNMTDRKTGNDIAFRVAHFWRFRDRKITEYSEVFDTVDVLSQAAFDFSFHEKGRSFRDEAVLRRLTPRELEIIALIANGLTGKEIAKKLDVSDKTVETHRRNIAQKTGLNRVADITRFALAAGIEKG